MGKNQWTDPNGTALPADWTPALPLVPNGNWTCSCGCAEPGGTASVDNIKIIGSPGTITSVKDGLPLWELVLSDGTPENDMRLDRFDDAGEYVGTPFWSSRATGEVTFNSPVLLSEDPIAPMEAATKQYVDANASGIPDAPDNQTYGRTSGAWNLVVPAAGGTFTGQTNLGAGGAVTSGALVFAGSAVCSIPDVSQLAIGGGSLGQVPATDGAGNLSWITPVTGGPYLPIAGGTITGSLTVNQVLTVQGSNSLVLNAPVTGGNQRSIMGMASNVVRWILTLGDQAAEGVGNAGSNFSLSAYSTTGAFLGTWLSIARADGSAVFNGGVTMNAGLAVNGLLAVNSVGNFYLPGGTSGQVLSTNGSGVLSWANQSGGIPDAPSDGTQYGRQSGAWTPIVGGGGGSVTVGATPPSSPSVGALWWDSVGGQLYVWYQDVNTSQWVIAVNSGSAASGGASISVGATPPVSPSVGALWWDANGGQLYVWYNDGNTSQWAPTTNQMSGIVPASTTVLGGVKVDGTSIKAAIDGTISTVLIPIGDNRIINGDMRIRQRAAASGTAQGYTVDRWGYLNNTAAARGTWAQGTAGAALVALGWGYNLGFTSSSAYTPAAGDAVYFYQSVEADLVSDFAWGTANAQPVTLSFWVLSTLTGIFGGSVTSYQQLRSYPFSYSIPFANNWYKIVINIPGDITGSWVMSGNSGALTVYFDLGTGASLRGPAGAWAAGALTSANGCVNVVAINGAQLLVTGVKLESGNVATPYNRQSMAKTLADCQRYYEALDTQAYAVGTTSSAGYVSWPFKVSKRATPTIAMTYDNTGVSTGTIGVGGVSATRNLGNFTMLTGMASAEL